MYVYMYVYMYVQSIQYFSNYICPKIRTKLLCTIDKLDTSGPLGIHFLYGKNMLKQAYSQDLRWRAIWLTEIMGFSNRGSEYLTRFEALQAVSLKNTRYIILVIIFALKLKRNYYAQ